MSTLQHDTDEAISFLQQWPCQMVQLTAIHVDAETKQKKLIEARSFTTPVKWDKVREWIDERQGTANIYFAINNLIRPLNKKAGKTDISTTVCLHVDIDVPSGDDQGTAAAIVERLQAHNPPPSIVIMSGGGAQAFWLLEPDSHYGISGNEALAEDFERYTRQLEDDFSAERGAKADRCHNVDRIMRLPGTINVPDIKKIEKGRKPALARLVHADWDLRYPLNTFKQAALTHAAKDLGPSAQRSEFKAVESYSPIDANDSALSKLPEEWKRLGTQGDTEGRYKNESGETDNSRMSIAFAKACVESGVSDETIARCLMHWPVGAAIQDKGSQIKRHLKRTIEKAHEFAASSKLAIMNERHHVVNLGGKTLVLTWDYEDEIYPGIPIATFRTANEFCKYFDKWNHFYKVKSESGEEKDVCKPLGTWWWDHSMRRQYSGIVYAPHINDDTVGSKLNLWRGFSVVPAAGDCDLYLSHLRDNVCVDKDGKPNADYFAYLIGWMAHCVQHPDRQGYVAWVMLGPKGIGKTVAAEEFGKLFGHHYTSITNPDHMTGKFNAHLQACSVLLADECFFAGDKRHEQILKTLITGDRIFIEPKGVNAFQVRNYLHIIMCTNNEWAVPASHEERRYFVLQVGEEHMQDIPYFKAICDQMDNGGRAALLHYLLNIDLSTHQVAGKPFEVRRTPDTDALRKQKERSRHGVDAFVENILLDARVPFSHVSKPYICITSGKDNSMPWGFDHYVETRAPIDLKHLGPIRIKRTLKEQWGCERFYGRINNKLVTGIAMPPLKDMRAKFEQQHGNIDWPAAKGWQASDEDIPF